jgi:hypothetical protein
VAAAGAADDPLSFDPLSFDRGPSKPPLLETTIGANFAATAAKYAQRDALVDVAAGRCWNYAELLVSVRQLATGFLRAGIGAGDRVGIWAPNRWEWVLVQYATAEIGAILVTINPAYRARELEYALRQSGVAMVIAARRFKTTDYAAMLDEVAPRCPDLSRVVLLDSDRWDELAGTETDPNALRDIAATLDRHDPVNIQYTSGTTGYPKAATLSHRNILNNGYLVGELLEYSAQDRICIPVPFYHCFGMVMGNLAATSHGACVRTGRHATRCAGRTVYQPLRRADDVHRRARSYGVRRLRTEQPAHRDHGRLAVPGRGDAQGDSAHAHAGRLDLLRHDRDVTGFHPDAHRRCAGAARRHRRPGGSASGNQGGGPGDRSDRAARRGRRVLHAGLFGDGRLLE